MKNLKILPMLLLLLSFMACKKDKQPVALDITKYCIVGKYEKSGVLIPFLFTFEYNAKAKLYADFGGKESKTTYTFANGELNIALGNGYTFKISDTDEKIIGLVSEDKSMETYRLVKLPADRHFNEDKYTGVFRR